MTVYFPECWICKHALITHGFKEDIFVGCQQTYKKEGCKFEQGEVVVTTSSITTPNKWLEGEASTITTENIEKKTRLAKGSISWFSEKPN